MRLILSDYLSPNSCKRLDMMSRRKPNPYEREFLYMEARDHTDSMLKKEPDLNPHDIAFEFLGDIPWLSKESADGIAAMVETRIKTRPPTKSFKHWLDD